MRNISRDGIGLENGDVVATNDLHGSSGRCDSEMKKIRIGSKPCDLHILLIHEIAHAVTSGDHGRKWQARMELAATHAETIGNMEVAEMIRKELEVYRRSPKVTADTVYTRIGDVLLDWPEATFRQILVGVGQEFGISSKEMLTRFPRCRAVYEKAHHQLKWLLPSHKLI